MTRRNGKPLSKTTLKKMQRTEAYNRDKVRKRALLNEAERELDIVRIMCREDRITVRQCSKYHFQFEHDDGWLINLYPTTGSVYVDPTRPQPPSICWPKSWTLEDAAQTILGAIDCGDN